MRYLGCIFRDEEGILDVQHPKHNPPDLRNAGRFQSNSTMRFGGGNRVAAGAGSGIGARVRVQALWGLARQIRSRK